MSTRIEQLQKMLAREPDDAFLLYGLALEHKKQDQLDDSLKLLDRVTAVDPDYSYAFFQKGQINETRGDMTAAAAAYRAGVEAATRAGDAKGRDEIAGALAMVEDA